jgi:hypothetical protein
LVRNKSSASTGSGGSQLWSPAFAAAEFCFTSSSRWLHAQVRCPTRCRPSRCSQHCFAVQGFTVAAPHVTLRAVLCLFRFMQHCLTQFPAPSCLAAKHHQPAARCSAADL